MLNIGMKTRRFFALLLACLMVLGLTPIPVGTVASADPADTWTVTLNLKDKFGNAVNGASVYYRWYYDGTYVDGATVGLGATNTITETWTAADETQTKDKVSFAASINAPHCQSKSVELTYASANGDIAQDVTLTKVQTGEGEYWGASVTVKDEAGNYIQDALVELKFFYNADQKHYASDWTNEYGSTNGYYLMEAGWEYSRITLKAIVSKTGYETKVIDATNDEGASLHFNVVLERPAIEVSIASAGSRYNGSERPLVTVTGTIEETDTVKWTVTNTETSEQTTSTAHTVPTATAVGTYSVKLEIERANYKNYSNTVTASIGYGTLNTDSLTITPIANLKYNGSAQPLFAVSGQGVYSLQYKTTDETDWHNWGTTGPTGTDADTYSFDVRAVQESYNPSVLGTVINTIGKGTRALSWVAADVPDGLWLGGDVPFNDQENFAVQAPAGTMSAGETIVYSIDRTDLATVTEDGLVTILYAGEFKLTATLAGNENYETSTMEVTVKVYGQGGVDKYIQFNAAETPTSYVLGTNGGVISTAAATKKDPMIDGDISYSIGTEVAGVSIDPETGELTVTDYAALAASIVAGNDTVTVTATKADTTYYYDATTSYAVQIVFDTATAWTASGDAGTDAYGAATGWYLSNVTLTAGDGYEIALATPEDFAAAQTISTEGVNDVVVYLRDVESGAISRNTATYKIDKTKPSVTVTSSTSLGETVLENISFGFYQNSITITVQASDATSGVADSLRIYESDVDEDTDGILTFDSDGSASITLTAQMRGVMRFVIYDAAGNTLECDGRAFVLDNISPTVSVSYPDPNQATGGVLYYGTDSVEATITVTEANFFVEDVVVTLSKDGGAAEDISAAVEWSPDAWVPGTSVYYGSYTIAGEGDYVLSVTYQDRSQNTTATYTSDQITIDTTVPTLTATYAPEPVQTVADVAYYDSDITATLSITERYFDANDVTVKLFSEDDETGADLALTWALDGDAYVATYTIDTDARGYYLTVEYTDKAGNAMEDYTSGVMTLDKVAPTQPTITYTDPIVQWWDDLLAAVSFGFYAPGVTVTFRSTDAVSGVESFTWTLASGDWPEGTSSALAEYLAETTVEASADPEVENGFIAAVELPKDVADQLRGHITVKATDRSGNESDAQNDTAHSVVVDTVAPVAEVSYTAATSLNDDGIYYYGVSDVTASWSITETNFVSDDVLITLSTDGGAEVDVSADVTWTRVVPDEGDPADSDAYVGSYTVSGDGDYVLCLKYSDRTNDDPTDNPQIELSRHFIIDTVAPVLSVVYGNHNVINTVDGRDYYDDVQSATVTIVEHNWHPEDVDIAIDGTAAASIQEQLATGNWVTTGDTHVLTLTYDVDANYTFHIAYTDRALNAGNEIADYAFTVDRVAPSELTVSYSQSVLDTVLDAVTFHFYDARMTVTISARDDVAGIRGFRYSYENASGVSGVNAELLNQAIAEGSLTREGNIWSLTFTIPKDALGSGNQFNGSVKFSAEDRSGNSSNRAETARVVVDSIAPTGSLQLSAPNRTEGDVSYYTGDATGTVSITEANFYAGDVSVTATKNGGEPFAIPTTWTNGSADSHVGTFTLSEDGDYIVTVAYRDKSGNGMQTEVSNQITIDKGIDAPVISINGVQKSGSAGAYNGDLDVQFAFADTNLDAVSYTLTRTSAGVKNEDAGALVTLPAYDKDGKGTVAIPNEAASDGIYDLAVTVKDKAGNEATSTVRFAVCRFGSVYEYSDYLLSLIAEGSNHHTSADGVQPAITSELVITEYNAAPIDDGTVTVTITRDGEVIAANYTAVKVETTEPDWYEYVYTISKDNFTEDGVYSISLSSAYSAADGGNNIVQTSSISVPENSNASTVMQFVVDTTTPDIRNITSLDQRIVNASSLTVGFTIVDVGGLKQVDVIVNGETVMSVTDFSDPNLYTGEFTLSESAQAQSVRIVATDLAGNVTDTDSDSFATGDRYTFNPSVTVSTNAFVRLYANKGLFWGGLGGLAAAIAAAGTAVVVRRRKKGIV